MSLLFYLYSVGDDYNNAMKQSKLEKEGIIELNQWNKNLHKKHGRCID
jgi:hypothetical protein